MQFNYPSVGRTHRGCVRADNEDAFECSERVWVVADGLGGHPGGEVASAVAAAAALHHLRTIPDPISAGDAGAALAGAVVAAHDAVRAQGREQRLYRAMGTTLVAAVVAADGSVQIGSVGDSRAYFLTGERLRQLTRDDNVAEEMLAAGEIDADEARTHRGQFMLTKALIADDEQNYAPQLASVDGPGRLLLCSDGLNAELTDAEIAGLLSEGDLEAAADALVEAALDAGGSDNVTVVLIDLP